MDCVGFLCFRMCSGIVRTINSKNVLGYKLSGGNNAGTPPPYPAPVFGKYKLADYRYGRKEMLALFTQSEGIPDEIKEFGPIVTDKSQEPLALHPTTEEEQ